MDRVERRAATSGITVLVVFGVLLGVPMTRHALQGTARSDGLVASPTGAMATPKTRRSLYEMHVPKGVVASSRTAPATSTSSVGMTTASTRVVSGAFGEPMSAIDRSFAEATKVEAAQVVLLLDASARDQKLLCHGPCAAVRYVASSTTMG